MNELEALRQVYRLGIKLRTCMIIGDDFEKEEIRFDIALADVKPLIDTMGDSKKLKAKLEKIREAGMAIQAYGESSAIVAAGPIIRLDKESYYALMDAIETNDTAP